MGILWKISRWTFRVGLFAGAVKLSIDNDIWSLKTDKGSDLYAKLKEYILPGTIVFAKKLPTAQEMQFGIGKYWNCGVNKHLQFL
uniref:MICOS complex subunit MIC13 n=1 Tax=Heterorhabditis bacteriophora TaxID=37862 RepID=A0A1I7XMK4_HETBA